MMTKGARFGFALLGAASMLAPAAASAAAQPSYGTTSSASDDALSRNLKIIAESPHNVGALIGAGKAALELGDAQAALTFFARAEQDAPRDGWVKKWMGSALVQLEQPAAAIKFFRDATSLGLPETAVAADRGLAWDISGDPRRAQRDYRLALSVGSDAEVTRRLALSLAISGEREPALQLLQGQLDRGDRAALRTRALVLALAGDRIAADRAVETAMPGPQAAALEPFLARLPSLSLADRALAVHLGHFPGNGRSTAPATTYAQNTYSGGLPAGYTPTPQPSATSRRDSDDLDESDDDPRPGFARSVTRPEPVSTESRRIPGTQSQASPARNRQGSVLSNNSEWSWSRGVTTSPRPAPVQTAAREAHRPSPAPVREAEPATPTSSEPPAQQPVEMADARPSDIAPAVQLPPPAPAVTRHAPAPGGRLAEVAAALDRIDEEQRTRSARTASTAVTHPVPAKAVPVKTRTAAAEPAPKPKKAPPLPREPARHWVQLAHGGSTNLSYVFEKLKDKAPKLLAGRTPWIALGSPKRLVVGPFPSKGAAESFAARLDKEDLAALAWTSNAGQKVEKLSDQ